MIWPSIIIAVMTVAASVFCDLRTGRIPNAITYTALVIGLGLSPLGITLNAALVGIAVAGGLFLIFWLAGGMGAGDVKLMAALGALLGWPQIWDVIFFTALCGAVMAMLFLIWRKIPGTVAEGELVENIPRRKQKMPYAVAIAAGTILALATG